MENKCRYHFHFYYDQIDQSLIDFRNKFLDLEKNYLLDEDWTVGKLHNNPVGPHTKPQFVVEIPSSYFIIVYGIIINEINRPKSILIHPYTPDELKDHTDRAIWIGDKLSLNLDKLQDSS